MRTNSFSSKFFLGALLSFALVATSAHAQSGLAIDPRLIVKINKTTCAYINGKWSPGAKIKGGLFQTSASKISALNKKLKKKTLSSSAKAKLRAQIAAAKRALSKNKAVCAKLPKGGPAPVITPATPLPGHTTVDWSVSAVSLQTNLGAEYLYFCPATSPSGLRAIYGNEIYTADSPICVAAVHLGLFVPASGGNVRFKIKPGLAQYLGSLRNGIQSNFFGSYSGSYVFQDLGTGQEIIPNDIPVISWSQQAQPLYTFLEQDFTFRCLAESGAVREIWGTDLYTYDSGICLAAVHSGRASRASGGIVTIRIKPGALNYFGSVRNGVSSSSYGSWGGSYIFVP